MSIIGENTSLIKDYRLVKREVSESNISATKAKYPRFNIHLRKDVINKTIIRALIRFYINLFKPKLNIKNKTRDFLFTFFVQNVKRKIISLPS